MAEDPFTAVLRQGAQRLLAQAIEVEVAMLLARYADRHASEGRQAIVRNGYLPEREVQTGIGAVRVKVPRVRDRSGTGIRFHSALLPPYITNGVSLLQTIRILGTINTKYVSFWACSHPTTLPRWEA
jgi:putative transposase